MGEVPYFHRQTVTCSLTLAGLGRRRHFLRGRFTLSQGAAGLPFGDVHLLDAPFRPGAMAASRGGHAFVLPQR